MTAIERMFTTWRGIIAALVACVLVIAPVAAQAKMAHHAASHYLAAGHPTHCHDGHTAALPTHNHADHGTIVADNSVTAKTSQQQDHQNNHDNSCCGTYCHSGCITSTVQNLPPVALATTYANLAPVNRVLVVPDQPQRPPSYSLLA